MSPITPCLWFDGRAREAAEFYCGVFPDSRIVRTSPGLDGEPRVVEFEIDGQPFVALDGGPQHTFTPAVSFMTYVDDQAELDERWTRLSDGGEEGPCGWLIDRFGVSWQVVPRLLGPLLTGHPARAARVREALMTMGKLDIAALQEAADNH